MPGIGCFGSDNLALSRHKSPGCPACQPDIATAGRQRAAEDFQKVEHSTGGEGCPSEGVLSMTITETIHGRVTVLSLKGNLLGEPDTTQLRQTVYQLTERGDIQVVLDLGGLKAINSSGLGVLVSALTSLRKRGGDLSLARLSDKVHALMMVTHLFRVFKVYDTVERAVTSLGR